MGSVDYLSYGFALVVLSGGVMGYLKVGKCLTTIDCGCSLIGMYLLLIQYYVLQEV